MTDIPLSHLLDTARRALVAAGAIVRRGAAGRERVSFKTPTSPVTSVDLAAEKAILTLVQKRFPSHGFLGEESTHLKPEFGRVAKGGYRWVVDPLDGTVNFIHRVPQSCVSVAVEKQGRVLAGGVFDPFRRELFLAARGRGATMNGRRIRVSNVTRMERAMLVTGFPYDRRRRVDELLGMLRPFFARGIDIRRFGAAALDLAWVACGRVDGFWERSLSPWDMAAGSLLVEEAGGRVTDFAGRPLELEKPERLLATNGSIHRAMSAVLRRY